MLFGHDAHSLLSLWGFTPTEGDDPRPNATDDHRIPTLTARPEHLVQRPVQTLVQSFVTTNLSPLPAAEPVVLVAVALTR